MGDYLRDAYTQPRPSRIRRVWAAFLDWCCPDRVVCDFPNLTDSEEE